MQAGQRESSPQWLPYLYAVSLFAVNCAIVRRLFSTEFTQHLSSNEGILGVAGADHPFPMYRAAHVPVALSTDDEGVSRIDITHEYQRAALDYHLSYEDLKQLVRTGMDHNFLPGEDLWAEDDNYTVPATACRGQVLGGDSPSDTCKALLGKSEKAAAEWELERRFRAFEARF